MMTKKRPLIEISAGVGENRPVAGVQSDPDDYRLRIFALKKGASLHC